MGIFGSRTAEQQTPKSEYLVKRCPECFISLPIDAKRCHSCKTRVGGVDRQGKAKKATNWYAYVMCVVSWGILIFYVQWAFF